MDGAKFKVGDTVFYMEHNKPKSGVIKGIIKCEGVCEGISNKFKDGEIRYYLGSYTDVNENDCYTSKGDLQDSIFKDL